jgi:cation transport regulator
MPYAANRDLPPSVKGHLPEHAQSIFREAFNHAWVQYARAAERREEIAHRVAWAAVKRLYYKAGRDWVANGSER